MLEFLNILLIAGGIIMRIRKPRSKVKRAYYQCEVCGRQIDSYDYYAYGKCKWCR